MQPIYHRAFPEGRWAQWLICFPIGKRTTPHPSQGPCCDLGYCLKAARGTQEFIRKTPFCQELVLYHTKKRRKQLSRFTSFVPESTIFIRFLRNPWKVIDKSNLPMPEQDGERDTRESAYASRNYFSPSLTFLHISWFLFYTVYIPVLIFCVPHWMLSHLIPPGLH